MISIAIDGPSGAGKSTIAKAVAKRLSFLYVDTGALYRTVGYAALCRGITAENVAEIEDMLKNISVDLTYKNGEQIVLLDGKNVSKEIRMPEVSMAASSVSALPAVRAFLLETQRSIAARNNIIMDGRDIGTVVLPDATLKIYLTATAEDRAMRRYEEQCQKGIACDYDTVLAEMKQRDYNDMHREIAPLKQAEDAVLLDTTGFELERSVEAIYSLVKKAVNTL